MLLQWQNQEKTIIAVIDDTGAAVLIEPRHAQFVALAARADIGAFLPPPPATAPQDERAAIINAVTLLADAAAPELRDAVRAKLGRPAVKVAL